MGEKKEWRWRPAHVQSPGEGTPAEKSYTADDGRFFVVTKYPPTKGLFTTREALTCWNVLLRCQENRGESIHSIASVQNLCGPDGYILTRRENDTYRYDRSTGLITQTLVDTGFVRERPGKVQLVWDVGDAFVVTRQIKPRHLRPEP